jgi:hypothetical protein
MCLGGGATGHAKRASDNLPFSIIIRYPNFTHFKVDMRKVFMRPLGAPDFKEEQPVRHL